MLLGSTSVKVVRKTLMKLSPGVVVDVVDAGVDAIFLLLQTERHSPEIPLEFSHLT